MRCNPVRWVNEQIEEGVTIVFDRYFPTTILVIVIIVVCAILFGCAHHDPWTKTDTAKQAAFGGLMLIDMKQTQEIASHDMDDLNPILSGQDEDFIAGYFATTFAVHTVAVYLLPEWWRNFFQVWGIAIEAGCVGWNYSVGWTGEW